MRNPAIQTSFLTVILANVNRRCIDLIGENRNRWDGQIEKKHQMGAWITREIHGQTVAGHGTAKRQEVLAPGQLEPEH